MAKEPTLEPLVFDLEEFGVYTLDSEALLHGIQQTNPLFVSLLIYPEANWYVSVYTNSTDPDTKERTGFSFNVDLQKTSADQAKVLLPRFLGARTFDIEVLRAAFDASKFPVADSSGFEARLNVDWHKKDEPSGAWLHTSVTMPLKPWSSHDV